MSERFCTSCDTNVEVVEGHCLLGHSVRLKAATSPLEDLRAEVDRAYEEASFRTASVVVEEGETPKAAEPMSMTRLAPPPPPPPPALPHRPSYNEMWAALEDDVAGSNDPMADFAPPPRMDWGPKRHLSFRR